MDKALILDLSSDDEVGVDDCSTANNFDWITMFLEDVGGEMDGNHDYDPTCNGGLFNLGDVVGAKETNKEDDDDDDDDVVVVGEVIVPKLKKVKTLVNKNSDVKDEDDDCVVLDGDPDKPKDEVKDLEEDSDDLVVVGETGQVACRDYPHPRHLCAKFPFSSTPHENHCEMCHCYVCDSLAPCPLWSSGISMDHCHATDKEECWKLERNKIKQLKNPSPPMPTTKPNAGSLLRCHPRLQQLSTGPKQLSRPTSTSGVSSTYGLPNIIRNQRSSISVASTRFQPNLISQQHLRSCNGYTKVQGNRGASLAPRLVSSRPMFKKSGPANRPVVSNQHTYRAPNNVSVACLQLPDQQFLGNLNENNSTNSTLSSLHLNLNTGICPPNMSSRYPGTVPALLQGYGQPSRHTPSSECHEYGHTAAVTNNDPYVYTSMNQDQYIPSVAHPSYTNVQDNATLHGEQQSALNQTISGPSLPSRIQTSADQSYSSAIFSFSSSNAQNSVLRSCQQSSAVENPLAQGGVPMHELLPSIEQRSGNTEHMDFDFENWLQDGEPIGSQDSSFFYDINSQASVPVPVDTGMLYFDFETSWKGLTHS